MQQSVETVEFRHVCARFATGVVVATVESPPGTPHGMTVNSFTSVSLQPPMVLFCVDRKSRRRQFFVEAKYFAINILGENQRHLSYLFASRIENPFRGVAWHVGKSGAPLLDAALGRMECKRHQTVEAGDHIVVFGEVMRADCRSGHPLVFFNSDYHALA
jgi:4-hydroxyphenylacetate 3-hydroxylase, reductase component